MFRTTSIVAAVKYATEFGLSEIELHERIQQLLKGDTEIPDIFYSEINQWQRYMTQDTGNRKLQGCFY